MRRKDPIRIGDAISEMFLSVPHIARKIADQNTRPMAAIGRTGHCRLHHTHGGSQQTAFCLYQLFSSPTRGLHAAETLKDEINRLSGIDVISTIIVK